MSLLYQREYGGPIYCIIEPKEEKGGLYIGYCGANKQEDFIKKLQIRAIVTINPLIKNKKRF